MPVWHSLCRIIVKINSHEILISVFTFEKEEKNKKFHRVERYYGSFVRSFALPDNVDETRADASFKDGMLSLDIPKTEESKQKAIDIKVK
ncbi:MAG: Hsp20/alpha crystallin family protein [Proteobacteria bacterium]|nr:Hsp20/alpha crystallin family protein [Pseudomonadota bacterium]